jgi:hypothetical protein
LLIDEKRHRMARPALELAGMAENTRDFLQGHGVIVVTAADDNYFTFAQDAVNSVLALELRELAVGFMDLGLQPWQSEWLRSRNVIVRSPETRLDIPAGADRSSHQMGYLARPFLRENFPGHQVYVWIDADAWLQDSSGLRALVAGAESKGAALVRQNEKAYRFWPWQIAWMHKHYTLGYGVLRGMPLAWRPMVNNGVFAMKSDARHWEYWRRRYQGALTRTGNAAPHDQLGLNAAVYLDGLPTAFLPATANWICDLATPMWDDAMQRFCVPYAPHRPISVLHLAGPAKTNTFAIKTTKGGQLVRTLRYSRLSRDSFELADGQPEAPAHPKPDAAIGQ